MVCCVWETKIGCLFLAKFSPNVTELEKVKLQWNIYTVLGDQNWMRVSCPIFCECYWVGESVFEWYPALCKALNLTTVALQSLPTAKKHNLKQWIVFAHSNCILRIRLAFFYKDPKFMSPSLSFTLYTGLITNADFVMTQIGSDCFTSWSLVLYISSSNFSLKWRIEAIHQFSLVSIIRPNGLTIDIKFTSLY